MPSGPSHGVATPLANSSLTTGTPTIAEIVPRGVPRTPQIIAHTEQCEIGSKLGAAGRPSKHMAQDITDASADGLQAIDDTHAAAGGDRSLGQQGN